MKRDFRRLSQDRLKLAVAKNFKIQNVLQCDDPNEVAMIINNELNIIIDNLAPQKRHQTQKNYLPYVNSEMT